MFVCLFVCFFVKGFGNSERLEKFNCFHKKKKKKEKKKKKKKEKNGENKSRKDNIYASIYEIRKLAGELAHTSDLPDLLLGNSAEELGTDDNRLLGERALSENLEVTLWNERW